MKKTTPILLKSAPNAFTEAVAGVATDPASVDVADLAAVVATEVTVTVGTVMAGMVTVVTGSEADALVEPVSAEELPVGREVTCELT